MSRSLRRLARPSAPGGTLYGESPPVVIGELQSARTNLPAEQAILFDQISERLSFPAIEPAGDGDEQQPKDRDVDHEREVISRTAFTTADGRRSNRGTIRESRSVFNGLAQVIVQSSARPGEITLTATSPGLNDATTTIEAARRGTNAR